MFDSLKSTARAIRRCSVVAGLLIAADNLLTIDFTDAAGFC